MATHRPQSAVSSPSSIHSGPCALAAGRDGHAQLAGGALHQAGQPVGVQIDAHIELLFKDESFWLPQRAIAKLFGVGVAAVSKHLKNIFDTTELDPASVVSVLETTATDGKVYKTKHYNLDAVIAVGYRGNSYQATQFRVWATQTLKEYVEVLRIQGETEE